jgi:hypothetical protein
LGILIVIIFLIVFAVFAYYAHAQQKQRRLDLAALASQLGWHFDPDADYSHDSEYAQFGIFNQGHSRYAFNTLLGAIDVGGHSCRAIMGDYHYQTTSSNGKTTTTHTHLFSYLLIHLPYQQLPDLYIRREGIFDSIKRAFGFDDIDFESAEFSKRYYVKSPDKRFAYDVVHPGMMAYLLACDPPAIDIEQGQCCLSDGSSSWSPDEYRANVACACRFFELWPKHLTSTLERA